MYLIKRYSNGRFYDTVEKTYITRRRLADLFESGESISILDTRTGDDVTRDVLTDILADPEPVEEEEAAGEEASSERFFGQLFKMGEELYDDYKKRYDTIRQNLAGLSRDEIDKLLAALKESRTGGLKEKSQGFKEGSERYPRQFYDWLAKSIERKVDEALKKTNLAGKDQIEDIAQSLDEIKLKLEKLERDIAILTIKTSTDGKDDLGESD